jgi:hypothetical protein
VSSEANAIVTYVDPSCACGDRLEACCAGETVCCDCQLDAELALAAMEEADVVGVQ